MGRSIIIRCVLKKMRLALNLRASSRVRQVSPSTRCNQGGGSWRCTSLLGIPVIAIPALKFYQSCLVLAVAIRRLRR